MFRSVRILTWILLWTATFTIYLQAVSTTTTISSEMTEHHQSTVEPMTEGSTSKNSPSATDQTSHSPNISPVTPGTLPEVPAEGLSSGEAAGVAIGTIAGVAAVGGGIFAGLKFTGRLG